MLFLRNRTRQLLAILVLVAVISCPGTSSVRAQIPPDHKPARNAILYILDGLGVSGMKLAREVLYGPNGRMELDRLPVTGRIIVRSTNEMVPDSAAMASAYAVGQRVPQHHLSMNAAGKALPTLWERARDQGFRVGVLSDARLTHATPAAFAAHVASRKDEQEIGRQMLVSGFDVLFSGGMQIFQEIAAADGAESVTMMARESGFRLVTERSELARAIRGPERLLGLFARNFLSYSFEPEIKGEVSLAEMTQAALLHLTRNSDDRFLLMVEAGKPDPTMHEQDAVEFIAQMRALEETLRLLRDWVTNHPDTLLVVVPDHSTAGLCVTEHFDAERFRQLATSSIVLGTEFKNRPQALAAALRERMPGITFTDEEVAAVTVHHQHRYFDAAVGNLVARKFGLFFLPFEEVINMPSTSGHSGEDVVLHAEGPQSWRFSGTFGAEDTPHRIADALGIDF